LREYSGKPVVVSRDFEHRDFEHNVWFVWKPFHLGFVGFPG
jgi:hypothetical protein